MYKRYLILWSIYLLSVPVNAANTLFSNGKYANEQSTTYNNRENKVAVLNIPNAEALAVTVEGETEKNYDFIIIYDSRHVELHRYSGRIPKTSFTVEGASIRVHFKSDGATVKSGVKVEVKEISLFHRIKADLRAAINAIMQQGTGDIYNKINQLLARLTTVATELSAETTIQSGFLGEQIAEQAAQIATIYHYIATSGQEIRKNHVLQLAAIEALQYQTCAKMTRLQNKVVSHQQSLIKDRLELENPNLPLMIQKLQIAIDVTEKSIKTLQTQIVAWENFAQAQQQLIVKVRQYSEQISFLLYFLSENAQLYELAAKNISLNKNELLNLNEALIDSTQLKDIVEAIELYETEITIQLFALDETYFTL